MDPLNVNRVRERTLELQRTADQVHQERDLRSTTAAEPVAIHTRPVEARPSSAKVGGGVPAEPAT